MIFRNKVFLIQSKHKNQNFYALKVIQKFESENWYERRMIEREVGLLAKKCPFLVESYATFANEVKTI